MIALFYRIYVLCGETPIKLSSHHPLLKTQPAAQHCHYDKIRFADCRHRRSFNMIMPGTIPIVTLFQTTMTFPDHEDKSTSSRSISIIA
jgi:hypothetical protein